MTPEDAILLRRVRHALKTPFVCPVSVGGQRMSRSTARMIERNLSRKPERTSSATASAGGLLSSPLPARASFPRRPSAETCGGEGLTSSSCALAAASFHISHEVSNA